MSVSSPNFHRLCVWLTYTFLYVNILNVTIGYWRFSDLVTFFGNFLILLLVWNVLTSNFYELCIMAEVYVKIKNKPL